MNARINETQIWYCPLCDKTINIKSILKHNNSETHKDKEKNSTVVKEYEITTPDIDELNHILNETIKDCRKNTFIQLTIDVYMIIKFKKWKIMKKFF